MVSFAGKLFFDALDDVVGHKGFAIVFADMTMSLETGFRTKITFELAAIVIFDDDYSFGFGKNRENFFAVEWNNPFHLKLACDDPFFSSEFFDSFADHALG